MPNLVVEFAKMHGAGNDFVIVDNRFYFFSDPELSALAARLCLRRYAVGADGLLALCDSGVDGPDFRMKYFNADGSRAGMCGNGARCLVRFAADAGIDSRPVRFMTDEGEYTADPSPDGTSAKVRLFLPPPSQFEESVLVGQAADSPVGSVAYVFAGVPHTVCFVEDVSGIAVDRWGATVRYDRAFPAGTNVNFVEIAGRNPAELVVRTYERGVEAETLACGTGAVASAVVAWLTGRVASPPVRVSMRGGVLEVGFVERDGLLRDVYLEGPVERVFRGTIELSDTSM